MENRDRGRVELGNLAERKVGDVSELKEEPRSGGGKGQGERVCERRVPSF